MRALSATKVKCLMRWRSTTPSRKAFARSGPGVRKSSEPRGPDSQSPSILTRVAGVAGSPHFTHISEDDFRDFVFINPIKLWAGSNKNFFKGTAVESEVAKVLASV